MFQVLQGVPKVALCFATQPPYHILNQQELLQLQTLKCLQVPTTPQKKSHEFLQ